ERAAAGLDQGRRVDRTLRSSRHARHGGARRLLALSQEGQRQAGWPDRRDRRRGHGKRSGDGARQSAQALRLRQDRRAARPHELGERRAIKTFVSGRNSPSLVQATVDEVSDNKSMFRTTFPASADSFLQGYLAGQAGFKKATAIAPNFNAGQDAVAWFEKGFEASGGKVVQKLLPRLGTPDFGSYIAQIDDSGCRPCLHGRRRRRAFYQAVRRLRQEVAALRLHRDRRRGNSAGPG